VAGWWGVVIGALVAGAIYRADGGRAWQVALGAGIAWAALLAGDAMGGKLPVVVTTLGGVMGVPGVVLIAFTVLFAAAIGWSAAVVAAALANRVRVPSS
jgi:hypothetical protein